jgi:hypothetical protein
VQHRVAGGLQPDQVGAADRVQEVIASRHVDGAHAPAASGCRAVVEQAAQAGVAVAWDDHARAHREQLEDGGDGGHPRGEADGRPTFEVADEFLERLPSRSAVVAGVLAPLRPVRSGAEVRGWYERHVERLAGAALAAAENRQSGLYP